MGFTPPYLVVRKVSGGWSVFPPTATSGDDLFIYPNLTDTAPYIKIYANDRINVQGYPTASGGSGFNIVDSSTLRFTYVNPDWIIENITADKNIYLKTAGTGKVKFGTHTAQADTPVTGYIDILDAAGNARKIAVISP